MEGGETLQSQKTIEDARVESGLTQEYMASKLGVSRQTYASLEKDPDRMTIGQARRVCSLLGKRYEEIIFSKMFSTTNASF